MSAPREDVNAQHPDGDGPEAARRRQIDAVFTAALELPREERTRFLDRACAGDRAKRTAVEDLLDSSDTDDDSRFNTGGAIRGRLWDDLEASVTEVGDLEVDARVGPYRVVREIGRGGMAVVYLAERVDGQFEQKVALKLLQTDTATDELVRRFLQERQILASLAHPNIAHLLDGGVTDDGRPFFAMEHVEGLRIDLYCDRHRLALPERLRLFVAVARAVEAAHRSLVIHRDLKPSNILVTDDGEVKLLDFGIAKPLTPDEASDEVPLTRTVERVMTPEYASPEQVRGEQVTTASDIYQLGLLLFGLLTGLRPYGRDAQSPVELVLAICEQEPDRPSEAVAYLGAGEQANRIASVRRSRPRRLRRALSGDLDAIVAVALRKPVAARYGSAAHLAEDVERYLAGRPIAARMDSVSYRAGRFARRYAGVVITAIAAVGLIGALIVFYATRLARERDRALDEADKANRAVQFLSDIFEESDPFAAAGGATSARELLDRGAARIATAFDGQPELRAKMTARIGELYRKLGLPDEARRTLQRALDEQRALYGDDHLEVARSQFLLGRLLIHTDGGLRQARALLERALAVQRLRLDAGDPEIATTMIFLARALTAFREYDQALALDQEALAIREAAFGPDHPEVAACLLGLAALRDAMDQPAAALPLQRRAIAILEDAFGPDHPRLGEALRKHAGTLRKVGGNERQTLQIYERAATILEAALGPDHPGVAEALGGLAFQLSRMGFHPRARALRERALAITERAYGPDSAMAVTQVQELALQLQLMGLPAEARPLFARSLAAQETAVGPDSPFLLYTLVPYAEVTRDGNDLLAARALFERALRIRRAHPDTGGDDLPAILRSLANVLLALGDSEAAEPLRREAQALEAAAAG